MVKNQEGAVYVPGRDIDQIGVWEMDESYRVYASGPVTIDVAGTAVPLSETPVVLNEGWNLAPYLPNHSQPVSTALTSILGSLERIESEAGTAYEPGGGVAGLDSLRPGQGYQVRMTRPDTLVYSEIQDPIVVNTLADALALQGIETGQHVQIRGYHEPGDGGGGLFEVRESACESDGGTCFVFDEDVSDEQSLVTNDASPDLPHSDLVWGTFSAQVGAEEGEVITDLDMHGGMSWQNGTDPFLDHKAGAVNSASGMNLFGVRRSIGDGDDYDITYRYRYATSDRRLVRMGVTSSVNVAWWGAPEADPANPQDAAPYINWAILAAHRLYQQGGIEWAYVDIPTEYYYHHLIRQRDGTVLRGVGPERPVPGESWVTNGKLTVTPGKAMYTHRNGYNAGLENDVAGVLGGAQRIDNHYLAEKWKIQNLELDGNYPNNTHPWGDEYDIDNVQNLLQNGGAWIGWYTSGSGGQAFGASARAHFENVHVHDYGGNGIATRPDLPVEANNIFSRNAIRNHSLYHLNGTDQISNITAAGAFWAVALKLGSKDDVPTTYTDVTYRDPIPNPEGYGQEEVFTFMGNNVTVDGVTIDLRGGGGRELFHHGPKRVGLTINNATIELSESGRSRFQDYLSIPTGNVFDGVAITDHGGGMDLLGRSNLSHNITVKDVTWQAGSGVNAPSSVQPLVSSMSPATDVISTPLRGDVQGLNMTRQVDDGIFRFGGNPSNYTPMARDLFVLNSSFDNVGSKIQNDNGRLNLGGEIGLRLQRIYLDSVTFNVPQAITAESDPRWFHGLIGGNNGAGIIRLRNCQDREGRVSDAVNQTFTSDGSHEGQDYVDIPTSLMSFPEEHSTTLTSSPSGITQITSVEVVDSNGNGRTNPVYESGGVRQRDPYLRVNLDGSIPAGETVTIDWTARVTPLDAYQTTGVFVSRPVFDQTYATGNGPWTVDLRGVAVSQESKEQMVYSVSSSDTGVVTASIGSDGYTLNLTEVGTGTATITVTGTIEGIGTAADTFEVVVEQ